MKINHNVNLSQIAYYRIGAKAKLLLDVFSERDLQDALEYIKHNRISPVYVLGLGSNLLLPDDNLEGVVLHLTGDGTAIKVGENAITVFSGITIAEVIKCAFQHNLAGLAWAGGLPSTVGGAIRGNAGCFGSEMKDIVESVSFVDLTDPGLKLQTFDQQQCQFGYRESYFKYHADLLIVSATFKLQQGDWTEMQKQNEIYQKNIEYRRSHHPLEYPSCGSVFKNISQSDHLQKVIEVWPDIEPMVKTRWYGKVSMAYIIGRLGFAGYRVGGAQVSQKHNNYISNIGNAKSADVKSIITSIQSKFNKTFGFSPEPEVQILNI